jgi:hypothetical protein
MACLEEAYFIARPIPGTFQPGAHYCEHIGIGEVGVYRRLDILALLDENLIDQHSNSAAERVLQQIVQRIRDTNILMDVADEDCKLCIFTHQFAFARVLSG